MQLVVQLLGFVRGKFELPAVLCLKFNLCQFQFLYGVRSDGAYAPPHNLALRNIKPGSLFKVGSGNDYPGFQFITDGFFVRRRRRQFRNAQKFRRQ